MNAMNCELSNRWLYHCIEGQSAARILLMLSVLDGEWTKVENPRELRHRKKCEHYWSVVNTQLYAGLGTWRMGE